MISLLCVFPHSSQHQSSRTAAMLRTLNTASGAARAAALLASRSPAACAFGKRAGVGSAPAVKHRAAHVTLITASWAQKAHGEDRHFLF